MTRITVAITNEQRLFIDKERRTHGNQSGVIRYALELLRKQKMIREMTEYFQAQPRSRRRNATEKLSVKSLRKLPAY